MGTPSGSRSAARPLRRAALALAFGIAGSWPAVAAAALVNPWDPAFAATALEFSGGGAFAGMTIAPDGRLLALGARPPSGCTPVIVEAFGRNGARDASFGSGGSVDVGVVANVCPDAALAITADRAGGIVVALAQGRSTILVRLTANGALDATFGAMGIQVVPMDWWTNPGLVVDARGRIVVAGVAAASGGGEIQFFAARLAADGTLDPGFGLGGLVSFMRNGASIAGAAPSTLTVRADGRLLIGTTAFVNGHVDFLFAGVGDNGAFDPAFGAGGFVNDVLPRAFELVNFDLQGTAIVGSGILGNFATGEPIVFRLRADGLLDPAFGVAGIAHLGSLYPFAADALAAVAPARVRVAVDAQGRIAVAGGGALFRLAANGALDATFGAGGYAPMSADGSRSGAAVLAFGSGGELYVAQTGAAGDPFATARILLRRVLASGGSIPGLAFTLAIEFYHSGLDHYFVTANAAEAASLDSGATKGWARTGNTFPVALAGAPRTALSPVCRFYGRPDAGLDSHFYSALPKECSDVAQRFANSWTLESSEVFDVILPDLVSGACPQDSLPVYRVYNGRADVNHRYAISEAVVQQMVAKGWIPEGFGVGVAMCAPLR